MSLVLSAQTGERITVGQLLGTEASESRRRAQQAEREVRKLARRTAKIAGKGKRLDEGVQYVKTEFGG